MKTELYTISQYESIDTAVEILKEKKINCLPVVKGKRLIGIVTSNDLSL